MKTAEYPNLPTPEWVKKQTTCIGGDVLIVGLSPQQAEEIIRYAKEKGIAGTDHNQIKIEKDNPLSKSEREARARKGADMPEGSVEVYLGHTTECHKPLFRSLGIPVE